MHGVPPQTSEIPRMVEEVVSTGAGGNIKIVVVKASLLPEAPGLLVRPYKTREVICILQGVWCWSLRSLYFLGSGGWVGDCLFNSV